MSRPPLPARPPKPAHWPFHLCAATVTPRVRLWLWARLAQSSIVVTLKEEIGPCYIWCGACQSKGYGNISIWGKNYLVHRISCFLTHGIFPREKYATHACDTPACWRPEHVRPGTKSFNAREAWSRLRRTQPTSLTT